MALTEAERNLVWARFMAECSAAEERFGALTKHQLRALVGAVDDQMDAYAPSVVKALPPALVAGLGMPLLTRLVFMILRTRAGID